MKFSICLPYMKADLSRQTLIDWCRRIDEGPFANLSCGERIIGPTLEMRATLAFACALTERVGITPSLYVLPMHNATWAAKEIATLDRLSNGRVTLTVGVGGREEDYRSVGADFRGRFQRLDEQINILRRVWGGESLLEQVDAVGPRPIQRQIPILAGAMGPLSIQRASRWADGLYAFSMNGEAREARYFFEQAEHAWAQSGRNSAPRKVTGLWYSLADQAEQHLQEYVFDYLQVSGAEDAKKVAQGMTRHHEAAICQAIESIAETGAEELYFVPATDQLSELERLIPILERYRH